MPVHSVVVGTQTGRDKAFVLDRNRWREHSSSEIEVDGLFILPEKLVPRWASGRMIHPFRIDWTGQRVVLPEEGRLPELDNFIASVGGKPKSFFPGNLDVLRSRKVIVRCLFDEPAAVSDSGADWMIPQGGGGCHALRSTSAADADFVEALLNSALYQWMLAGLAQAKSAGYGQLLLHHWKHIPRPILKRPSRDRIAIAGRAVRSALRSAQAMRTERYWNARKALDELVFNELRIAGSLRTVVQSELVRRP